MGSTIDNKGTAGSFDNIITDQIQVINAEDSFDLHEQTMQQSEITTCNARNCGNGLRVSEVRAIQSKTELSPVVG